MKNKSCKFCLNDYTVKKVNIDKNGKCNFCNTYEKYYDNLHNYEELESLFLKKITNNEGYEYESHSIRKYLG